MFKPKGWPDSGKFQVHWCGSVVNDLAWNFVHGPADFNLKDPMADNSNPSDRLSLAQAVRGAQLAAADRNDFNADARAADGARSAEARRADLGAAAEKKTAPAMVVGAG